MNETRGDHLCLKRSHRFFIAAALFFVLGAVTAFAEEMDVRYLYTTSCASSLQVSGTTGTNQGSTSSTLVSSYHYSEIYHGTSSMTGVANSAHMMHTFTYTGNDGFNWN